MGAASLSKEDFSIVKLRPSRRHLHVCRAARNFTLFLRESAIG